MNAATDKTARSLRPDVRNPVLKLPGVVLLQMLPSPVKAKLVLALMDIRKDAHANAEKCWRKHKSPMAVYWKVVAVYCGHIARALRPQQNPLSLAKEEPALMSDGKISNEHAADIGRRLARLVFNKRGNHSEVHLREVELAAICAFAAERGAAIPDVEVSDDRKMGSDSSPIERGAFNGAQGKPARVETASLCHSGPETLLSEVVSTPRDGPGL